MEDLFPILCSIESACNDINRLMRRISTDDLSGLQGSLNVQGEDQKKLDIIANRVMKTKLCCSGKVSIIASEEDDEACLCTQVVDNQAFSGTYLVCQPMFLAQLIANFTHYLYCVSSSLFF